MSNTINTHHALAYFKWRLSVQTDELNRQEAARVENKKKYESGLWFKIFKTPYERSSLSYGDFSIYFSKSRITKTNTHIATCNYHIKCGDLQIHWEFDHDISGFYDWAEENNIPY